MEENKEVKQEKKKITKKMKIIIAVCIILILAVVGYIIVEIRCYEATLNKYEYQFSAKPVIYLYPEEKTDVNVTLDVSGELFVTYPEYKDGWNITAYPDGKVICEDQEYSYLFWEAYSNVEYDLSKGFVVKGEDTAEFLREKLEYMGLTPVEYNEFVVYWLPLMIENEYNLISFQDEIYTDNVVLNNEPEPDSILRVFMAFKGLDEKIEVEEQEIKSFEREGFCVIEWGGTEIK